MADPSAKSTGEEKGPQMDTTQDHNMNIILKDQVPVFTVFSLVLKISHCPKLAVRYVLAESTYVRYGTLTKHETGTRYYIVPGLSLSKQAMQLT
jgi:hypothetical protein